MSPHNIFVWDSKRTETGAIQHAGTLLVGLHISQGIFKVEFRSLYF